MLLIESLEQLRQHQLPWDDLWQRSPTTLPTMRAELIAFWAENFVRGTPFRALVVQRDGQFVAALPLVEGRVGRVVRTARLPGNGWWVSGDFLLDPDVDAAAVCDQIVRHVGRLPWPLLSLYPIEAQTARWQALHESLARAGHTVGLRRLHEVGVTDIDHDWPACQARWSKHHRSELRRRLRQLEGHGHVQLVVHNSFAPGGLEPLLRAGFEMEDRGWKGQDGSSVLAATGMFPFYLRAAEELSRLGQLELVFLTLGGRPIAFRFGFLAKGVFVSLKKAYDPEYARFGPFQLLVSSHLEQCHADSQRRRIDTLGPIVASSADWVNGAYDVSQLVADTGSVRGALLARAYVRSWPPIGALRDRLKGSHAVSH
jgi:CelD/BcsL family acetyltransferase involved in cellulose biosynthesis